LSFPDPEFVNELSPQQCRDLLEQHPEALFLDCREANEFAYCRIEGGTLVPLSQFAGMAESHFPSKDSACIIYCHHGVRSLNATFYLREQGYSHVYSMHGGIDLWSLEIDPSVPRY
jgi:rhodanese-related sulfurtransferase